MPTVRSVDEYGRDGKQLAVPGYVFTPQYAPGTVQVPEDEWKIIEALADPAPSVFDHANRTFAEGPLRDVEAEITDIEAERIRLCVKLLGENREYWLAVTPLDPETAEAFRKAVPEMPVSADGGTDESGGSGGRTVMSEKAVFTQEQEAEILARAEEVGTKQAAEEYSVSWQVIAGMKRRARGKKAGTDAPEKPEVQPGRTGRTESEPEASPGRKRGRPRKADSMPEAPGDEDGLRVENAVMREKAAALEKRVRKLNRVLQIMMGMESPQKAEPAGGERTEAVYEGQVSVWDILEM